MNGSEGDEPLNSPEKQRPLRKVRALILVCARERVLEPAEYAVVEGFIRRHVFNLN